MGKLDSTTDIFESQFVDNVAVVHLKDRALEIVTNPQGSEDYYDHLGTINDSPEVSGYVQINDSEWDSQSAVDALVDSITKDSDAVTSRGRYQGYKHDLIAARFRHSLGRILISLIKLRKPSIAGMQGRISGEYLGHTLAFDVRIATVDTTFSFDNMRTGLPASAGLTCLLPRYIGIGRAMSLIQTGLTIDAREAYALGIITDIVDNPQELAERCLKYIKDITSSPHNHLVGYHRQHILPPISEVESALEQYYDAMGRSIIQLRKNR